jgi:hypothetical protein
MSDRPTSRIAEVVAAEVVAAEVVVDVDYRSGAFEIVIVNIGDAVAHDVKVKFSRNLVGARDVVVSELPIFQRLRTLPPGKQIRVFLDSADAVFRRRKTNTFSVVAYWNSADGTRSTASYTHDLDAYRDLPEMVVREWR